MDILRYIVPILVGALIGYCTNYIAIKMLFKPKKAVRLGRFILPFTPGIIPKNQPRIAKAVGDAVGKQLFTCDDIKGVLLSDDMSSNVTDAVMDMITTDNTVEDILKVQLGDEKYEDVIDRLYDVVCDKIEEGIKKADLSSIIVEAGKEAILEKVQNSMIGMFVNDELIQSFAEPMKNAIDNYIDEHGEEKIIPLVSKGFECIEKKQPKELLGSIDISMDMIEKIVSDTYSGIVNDKVDTIINQIDISGIVEKKLNEMDIDEIEDLVMSVMKNELQAVINLGALIGAVIGVINIFF